MTKTGQKSSQVESKEGGIDSTIWREELQNHIEKNVHRKKGWEIGTTQWFHLGKVKNIRKVKFGFKPTQLRQCNLPSQKGTGYKAHWILIIQATAFSGSQREALTKESIA